MIKTENIRKFEEEIKELKSIYDKAYADVTFCDSNCNECEINSICTIMLDMDDYYNER